MNYYVIGIGGTGAKCIEALTHLCASGMMPDGNLYVLFVDPDKANGSLERAQITLQQYVNCKSVKNKDMQNSEVQNSDENTQITQQDNRLRLGNISLFKTGIERARPDLWSPFGDETQPNLGDFFQYNVLKANNEAAAHLFDVLYSPRERETTLDKGFRGHPSIGAAVMAKTVDLGQGEPWGTLWTKIQQDRKTSGGAKIFLFASVFGGTGASGFPTLARLINNELVRVTGGGQQPIEKVKIGGALLLPYFSFIPENDNELKASSENFLMNTQVALKYYYQQKSAEIYNTIYLLGDEALSNVDFSLGAKTQKNEPHFLELYAALSAIDFFTKSDPSGYNLIARQNGNALEWTDFPDGNKLRNKVGQMVRFAFAYMTAYFLMLDDIRSSGGGYRAPWFIDFFTRRNVRIQDSEIQAALMNVNNYCESFLKWIAGIQTSAKDEKINLVKWDAFAQITNEKATIKIPQNFTLRDFGNLIFPIERERSHTLSNLWERMSTASVKDTQVDDVGRFVQALYIECAK